MSRRVGLHLTWKSRASGADSMIKMILLVMSFVFLPRVAFAQTATDPGDGTDLYRVNREVEAMTRDGRWQRLLDEANGVRQAVTPAVPFPQPSTHTPVRPRALPELRLEAARHLEREKAEKPEHEEYDNESFEHVRDLSLRTTPMSCMCQITPDRIVRQESGICRRGTKALQTRDAQYVEVL